VARRTLATLIAPVVRRLAGGAATVLLVLSFAFLLLELQPGKGSWAESPRLSAADRARLERTFGLDRPPLERYLSFLGHALRGEFGVSLSRQQPVRRVLAQALGPTLLLAGSAVLVAFALGLALGTRAAIRPRGLAGWTVHRALPALDALPPFWLGLIAIYVFAWKLDLLPASPMHAPGGGGTLAPLRHLLLPCLVLGVPGAAPVARHHAAAFARELAAPHVRAAEALGLPRRQILARAMRTALHPAITLLGLALPTLVGGAVVVEVVFSWPGLGRVHQEALASRDPPLALGGLALIAVVVVAGGILSDLLSAWIDPRWRGGTKR